MNGMNTSSSNDEGAECPLCMEPLEVDDINFYPCTCGYQICRFCWHRIRTDENELCPACRKAYPENPADFTPLSQEQISALKTEKRQRDQQRKQKITENRKHLANVRVVQKNLVFVVGLPPRLADAEILKKHEYFGKYGKIHKVVINPSTTYAGVQGPSASAYVTYCSNNDALRAIQSVNNIMIDGRLIKTSLGTTKYCSHFMKNQQCPKPDCMYLHELGDPEASFTKEEMHQGKHQEYEKRLHDALIAQTAAANNAPNDKLDENDKLSGDTQNGPVQNKEAWPCLSVSPVNKETNGKTNGKSNKENSSKKSKGEKSKAKKITNGTHNNNNNNNSNQNTNVSKDTGFNTNNKTPITAEALEKQKPSMSADEELNLISEIENDALLADLDEKADSPSLSSTSSVDSGTVSESASGKSSPGSFPDHPLIQTEQQKNHLNQVQLQNKANLELSSHHLLNESFGNVPNTSEINTNVHPMTNVIDTSARFSKLGLFDDNNSFFSTNTFQPYFNNRNNTDSTTANTNSPQLPDLLNGTETNKDRQDIDKLNLLKGLGDFNSQLNNLTGYNTSENWESLKYALSKTKQQQQLQNPSLQLESDELLGIQELQKHYNFINSLGMPHFNGLQNDYNNSTDIFQNSSNSSSNNDPNRLSQILQQQLQQSQQQNHLPNNRPPQQQQQPQQQPQNSLHSSDNINNIYAGNMSRFFDFHKNQQQQQQQQQQFLLNGHSPSPINTNNDHNNINMTNLLDNNRMQYIDHSNNGLLGSNVHKQRMLNKYDQLSSPQQQQQQQQQTPQQLNNHNNLLLNQQNNRLSNHYTQNASVDDDLGFDPFMETQKGLAELLEMEMIQQQSQNNHSKLLENCQRIRMPPPPGFNHMNAFGLGVPRAAQSSKILPFMNMGSNSQQQTNSWGQQQQQQQNLGYQQQQLPTHDQSHLSQQNHQLNKSGYGSMSDWTALDPAIVSFRQFPTFMSGQQQQQQPPLPPQQSQQHNSSSDIFMPHLNPQQQMAGGSGGLFENKLKNLDFSNRNGMSGGSGGNSSLINGGFGGGINNLQNSIINQQQQNSPAQVNFSHSNWLNSSNNTDQQTQNNIFMNNLTNGFSNNFDKFSIPMPPGFQTNGNKQQKAVIN